MSQHTENSSYREKLIEHLFIGDLLRLSWFHHECSLEIAKPEVDNSGYDLIAESKGRVRHIQLKTSMRSAKTATQKVHTKLGMKPSGCVVWIHFNEDTLELGPFFYFAVNEASLVGRKVAKHTKGNKDGFKADRQKLRVVPKSGFMKLKSIRDVYEQLFEKV